MGYPNEAKRARCACGYDVLRQREWRDTSGSIDPDDWHDNHTLPGCGGCR